MKKIVVFVVVFSLISSTFANSVYPIKKETKNQIIELSNAKLAVKIALKGAEVISIFNKKENFEHLWQGKKPWTYHAPILFPVVGKLKNKSYKIDGKTYHLKNHGFANKSLFKLISKTKNKVVLALLSNKETLKMYPFKFKLLVTYTLKGSKLKIKNQVINLDNQKMYFSIGSHPGFNIPYNSLENFNDYYIAFSRKENADRIPYSKKETLISQRKLNYFLHNTKVLPINHALFKDRVVILEGLKSCKLTIKSKKARFGIQVKIKDFPYLGIWSPFKKDVPLVCIEPWYGISDTVDTNGDFKTKLGIQNLDKGKTFTMKYYIKVVDFK